MDFKNLTRVFGAVALLAAACGDDEATGPGGANCQGAKCDNAAEDDNDGPARTCGELITNYPGEESVVDEPEDPPAPQPDPDGDPGDLSCDVRGCAFDQGASCQCDAQCGEFGDCCDFGLEGRHDGPSQACE